jgi:CRP-like cAMP-binding protein
MTAQTRIELLQRMPIFGALKQETLQFLLAHARMATVRADEFFFREGEQANAMYVLEAGRVAVLKGWQGRELLLHYLGQGDCFGEMGLLDLFPRSASVRAAQDCVAIELTPANLYQLYERDAEQFALIQMNIGREMCRRLRESDEALFHLKMGAKPEAEWTAPVAEGDLFRTM